MLELQLLKNNNLLEINIDFLARSFLIQPMTSIIIVLNYFVLYSPIQYCPHTVCNYCDIMCVFRNVIIVILRKT